MFYSLVRHPYSEIIIFPLAFCSVAIIMRDQMWICDNGGWCDVRWKKTLNWTRAAREESFQDACASPLHPHKIPVAPVASSFRRRHRCRDAQVATDVPFVSFHIPSSVREPVQFHYERNVKHVLFFGSTAHEGHLIVSFAVSVCRSELSDVYLFSSLLSSSANFKEECAWNKVRGKLSKILYNKVSLKNVIR